MDPSLALYLVSALLILTGLIGTVLPVLPGLPLMFAGMLLAAWTGDFAVVGGWSIAGIGLLALLGLAVDFVASLLGAKRVGASTLALVGAALGAVVGLFFGLPGLLIGPFLGAVLGELAHGRDAAQAARVGTGTWIGLIVGAAAKIALAFTMLGAFGLAVAF